MTEGSVRLRRFCGWPFLTMRLRWKMEETLIRCKTVSVTDNETTRMEPKWRVAFKALSELKWSSLQSQTGGAGMMMPSDAASYWMYSLYCSAMSEKQFVVRLLHRYKIQEPEWYEIGQKKVEWNRNESRKWNRNLNWYTEMKILFENSKWKTGKLVAKFDSVITMFSSTNIDLLKVCDWRKGNI